MDKLRSVDRSLFKRTCPDAELVARAEHAARRLIGDSQKPPEPVAPPASGSLPDSSPPSEEARGHLSLTLGASTWVAPYMKKQTDDDVTLHDFASVEKSLPEVTWLWEGWLPRGLVTVLASSPGEGKSALALEVARRVVSCVGGDPCVPPVSSSQQPRNEEGPPLADARGKHMGGPLQEKVILVDTEASEAILRRRVREWSIPKERLCVFASAGPVAGMVGLSIDEAEDWRRLESAVIAARPALVIVDSLSGAHAMDENSSRMRFLLLKLARLARDSQAAFLVVHHLRKRSRSEPDAATLERLRGSSTLAQVARCVWTIDRPDPNDPRRRLSQVKNNLVALAPPIGFTIGPTGLTFCDAPKGPRGTTQAAQAAEFVERLLADGPLPVCQIWQQTDECGFSRKSVFQGSHLLGVVKSRREPTGPWVWDLPGRKSILSS
jgi:KaiC/GvpD/RAD55 family RecA-like ATPase